MMILFLITTFAALMLGFSLATSHAERQLRGACRHLLDQQRTGPLIDLSSEETIHVVYFLASGGELLPIE